MASSNPHTACPICGKPCAPGDLIPVDLVRPALVVMLRKNNPGWSAAGSICREDLNLVRSEYVLNVIEQARGELTDLDREVVESMREQELVSRNVDQEFEEKLSFGDRIADKVATFGGSWNFIITFSAVLFGWILLNQTGSRI